MTAMVLLREAAPAGRAYQARLGRPAYDFTADTSAIEGYAGWRKAGAPAPLEEGERRAATETACLGGGFEKAGC